MVIPRGPKHDGVEIAPRDLVVRPDGGRDPVPGALQLVGGQAVIRGEVRVFLRGHKRDVSWHTPRLRAGKVSPQVVRMIKVQNPDWLEAFVDWERLYYDEIDRMRFVVSLSRENVVRRGGGPFAAAVFERDNGRLVSIGTNMVATSNNSMLHGEVVALMLAEEKLGSYTLAREGMPAHELVTSCEPCAMCLGATLWSGVRRLVCGAMREDAIRSKFDEGPVFPESYDYLERRGIEVVRGVLREEAAGVLDLYVKTDGLIYNA
jgi:tRNA(Arg) A34 adenosine deaminase TadA